MQRASLAMTTHGSHCRAWRLASLFSPLLLLLLLVLGTYRTSSFLLPVAIARTKSPLVYETWARSASSSSSSSSISDATQPASPPRGKGVGADVEGGHDGNQAKSPAGLTLEGVYKRFKMETHGLDDGIVGLESKDADYGVEIVKVKMPRVPSLGVLLSEVARGGDGRGLVLVSGTQAGGNAEATGQIFVGDTLCWVGVEPDRMKRVEALDWDQTISALGSFERDSEITLVSKRLVRRETIKVQFQLPDGNREFDIKAGSNLRGEMIRLDVPVYDPKTLRYDQPYATGNCSGEGICGTCFVEVENGDELLSPPDEEELALLANGNLPARWRLSCKTIVGRENTSGAVRVKAVPQTEWREQRRMK